MRNDYGEQAQGGEVLGYRGVGIRNAFKCAAGYDNKENEGN